jgi:hypothetical protein
VRERRRPEQLGEGELTGVVEVMLLTEEDHLVVQQCLPDRADSLLGQVAAEPDIADHGADRAAGLGHGDLGCFELGGHRMLPRVG